MPLSGLRIYDYGDVPIDLSWQQYFSTVEKRGTTVLRHPFSLFLGGGPLCDDPTYKGLQ